MENAGDFENGRISNFQRHVTLTLTLDRATWHIVVHHSSTSIYTLNFIRIGETFCGPSDVRTYGRTNGHRGRLCYVGGVDLNTCLLAQTDRIGL